MKPKLESYRKPVYHIMVIRMGPWWAQFVPYVSQVDDHVTQMGIRSSCAGALRNPMAVDSDDRQSYEFLRSSTCDDVPFNHIMCPTPAQLMPRRLVARRTARHQSTMPLALVIKPCLTHDSQRRCF